MLLHVTLGKQRCCGYAGCFTNDYPFNHMPLPHCPDKIEVSFRLYTRTNPTEGQIVTRTTIPPLFEENKPTVFVTHGYLNWIDIWWMTDFKDAFLVKYDYNVIIVGWAKGAQKIDYRQAASNTRVAGKEIAFVAQHLVERGGADRAGLWCAGHSLGSHVCGHAGQNYKLGRVTGLDPAGPWFADKDWSIGINPSSGDLVDIWHTNGETALITGFGTLKRLGHVDFYPNGGGFQPGCIIDPRGYNITEIIERSEEEDFADLMPFCSHLRVLDLFQESITSDCQMYARHFCVDESNIPASCFNCENPSICGLMGMDALKYRNDGMYFLSTAAKKPFCQG